MNISSRKRISPSTPESEIETLSVGKASSGTSSRRRSVTRPHRQANSDITPTSSLTQDEVQNFPPEFNDGLERYSDEDEVSLAVQEDEEGGDSASASVTEEYFDPTFYEKMETLLQKTRMDPVLLEKMGYDDGRKAVEHNLQEIRELIRSGKFSSSELVGAKTSERTRAREQELIEDARRQVDDEAYEKMGRSEILREPAISKASLLAIKNAEEEASSMSGEGFSFSNLSSMKTIFDNKEEAYNRLKKALDEGPPIYEGPECPVCNGATTDEELQEFGKCSFCRAEDLADPSVHLLRHFYSDRAMPSFPPAAGSTPGETKRKSSKKKAENPPEVVTELSLEDPRLHDGCFESEDVVEFLKDRVDAHEREIRRLIQVGND